MINADFDIESGVGNHIDSSSKSGMCSEISQYHPQLDGQQDGDSKNHGGKVKGKGTWREKLWRNRKRKDDDTVYKTLLTRKDKLKLATEGKKLPQNLRDYTNGMLVVATLIATVSFTAGFTLPGGYQGDGPDRGVAALARRASFRAFLVFDTASMISSLLAIWFLAQTVVLVPDSGSQTAVASFAAVAVPVAFYCMVVAFGTGVYAVMEPRFRWLGIAVLVSSCLMPLYVVLLSPLIVPGRLTDMKKEICTLLRAKTGK